MHRARTGWLLIAVSLLVPAASPNAAVLRFAQAGSAATIPLAGAAAWSAMLGNTITGTTPDGAFSEYFRPDGSFVHTDRDGPLPGTWSLKGDQVCFAYPDEDEIECRTPEVSGHQGTFTGADGARYPFELLPGNANNL